VLDEHVEFLERALVEQQLDALPRGQLAAGVLRFDALFAAAELGAGATSIERFDQFDHALRPNSSADSGASKSCLTVP
jgi:hypothetical protein